MNKFELVVNHDQQVSEQQLNEFEIGLEKIKNNVPIQYITNHQEFMKLDFYVDENVLIPQPDTEILVEEVIKYVNENTDKFATSSPIKSTPLAPPEIISTSLSLMCRLSSLRCVVIPKAPTFSQTKAACKISGSLPPLAFLNVAMWSIFTPSFIPNILSQKNKM